MDTRQLLDHCSNISGRLQPEVRKRLLAVIENPCERTWENAYSLVLNGRTWRTLWQAIMVIDPTFPNEGPALDQHCKRIESWGRIPDRDAIVRAITFAVTEGVDRTGVVQ